MNVKLPLKGTAYVYRSDIWDGRGQGGGCSPRENKTHSHPDSLFEASQSMA